MARIGERIVSRQRLTTGAATAPRFTADNSIGRALTGLGSDIQQFAERDRLAREKVDRFKAAKDLETLGSTTDQQLLDSLGNIQPGAVDYTKGQLEVFNKNSEKFLASVPENLKPEFEVRVERLRGSVSGKAARTELAERQRFYKDGLADTGERLGRSLENNPDGLVAARRSMNSMIDGADLPPGDKESERDNHNQLLTESAVQGLIQRGQFEKARDIIGMSITKSAAKSRKQPRGIRNNNPGNIEDNAKFSGKVGSDGRFAKFSSPEAGIRAIASQLKIYQSRDGLVTVKDMIGRWAPSSENNTAAYVDRVSNAMGIAPDQSFDFEANPELAQKMVAAIILHENGSQPYTPKQIASAVGGEPLPPTALADGLSLAFRRRMAGVIDRSQGREANRINQAVPDHIASLKITGAGIDGLADRAATIMDADQFAEFKKKEQFARRFFGEMEGIKNSTPEEMVETLKRLAPKSGSRTFTEQLRLHTELTAGAAAQLKRRENDPAGVVVEQTEVNESAVNMAAVLANPTATAEQQRGAIEAYATTSLAEQARLGIPPESRRILTQPQSQAIVREFNSSEEGGQNAAQLMRTLSSQWGGHWPRVLQQLSKDLPGAVMVIGAMDTPGQELAAERLAELTKIGSKALSEGLDSEDLKSVEAEVSRQVREEFGLSLPDNFTGIATANTVAESATLLAIDNLRQGDSASSAATRAYQDVIGKKYDFVGPSGRPYRVPKNVGQLAETGADGFMALLNNGEDIERIELPAGFRERLGSDAERAYQDELKKFGFWLTGPTEQGLVLYDSRTGAAVMVRDESERLIPFEMTWPELSVFADDLPAPDLVSP